MQRMSQICIRSDERGRGGLFLFFSVDVDLFGNNLFRMVHIRLKAGCELTMCNLHITFHQNAKTAHHFSD